VETVKKRKGLPRNQEENIAVRDEKMESFCHIKEKQCQRKESLTYLYYGFQECRVNLDAGKSTCCSGTYTVAQSTSP
jgi:hypothetical protein